LKIGLISDTHGFLDPDVFKYFENCDEVWHAGDIGTVEVLDQLEQNFPVKSVYGNIDGHQIRSRSPEYQCFVVEDIPVLIIHIAAKPPVYNHRVRTLINEFSPKLLVCGHSHILKVQQDHKNKLLFMNPGAAGRHGFHKVRTLLRFEINAGVPSNLEVVELGPRSKLT
jgi:hypothetical protein